VCGWGGGGGVVRGLGGWWGGGAHAGSLALGGARAEVDVVGDACGLAREALGGRASLDSAPAIRTAHKEREIRTAHMDFVNFLQTRPRKVRPGPSASTPRPKTHRDKPRGAGLKSPVRASRGRGGGSNQYGVRDAACPISTG